MTQNANPQNQIDSPENGCQPSVQEQQASTTQQTGTESQQSHTSQTPLPPITPKAEQPNRSMSDNGVANDATNSTVSYENNGAQASGSPLPPQGYQPNAQAQQPYSQQGNQQPTQPGQPQQPYSQQPVQQPQYGQQPNGQQPYQQQPAQWQAQQPGQQPNQQPPFQVPQQPGQFQQNGQQANQQNGQNGQPQNNGWSFLQPAGNNKDSAPFTLLSRLGWFALGFVGGFFGMLGAWLMAGSLPPERRKQAVNTTWLGFLCQAILVLIYMLMGGAFPFAPMGATQTASTSSTGAFG